MCKKIALVRLVTLLLIVTLTGPSVGALVCDWVCASTHRVAAPTESNCHGDPGPAQTATFAAGHECHVLATLTASFVTGASQVVNVAVTVESATLSTVTVQGSFAARRPDRSHAPPPIHTVPLRI